MVIQSPNNKSMSITKSVAAYTLMPDIWSRLVGFVPRFGLMAYLMAIIFESVHLLPKGHKFSRPQKIEDVRIRDVLAMAANNLHGGIKNADQYIVFGMFILGIVLLVLQFVFLFAMLATKTADAAIPFAGLFLTADPRTDMAHLMMDKVFGIPGFFNSCFDPSVNNDPVCAASNYSASVVFPDSFQSGLQALFRFYSMGMVGVAGFVVFYYIIAMILETTNTGVPFGRRFQSIYTPLRLVIAVSLLLPLAYGYNTGQYIVLLSAKYGSALATNSWLLFNNRVGDNPMGLPPEQLVGVPKVGEINSVVNFMYLAQTCRAAYELSTKDSTDPTKGVKVEPYMVISASSSAPSKSMQLGQNTTFDDAKQFSKNGDVKIIFGEKKDSYKKFPGNVRPLCGAITMPSLSKKVQGVNDLYNIYFKNVLDIWFNGDLPKYGKYMACVLKYSGKGACPASPGTTADWNAPNEKVAGQQFYISTRQTAQANFKAQLDAQIKILRKTANPETSMDLKTLSTGWGGAGLWFNKVMSFNGAVVDALHAVPVPTQMPMIMEYVAKKKKEVLPNVPQKDPYSMTLANGKENIPMDKYMTDGDLGGDTSQNAALGKLLSEVYTQVQDTKATTKALVANSDNPVKNLVTLLFGQTGLFDFRANSDVFPLAKLAMMGRDILNKTITLMAARALMTGAGGVLGAELGPMGDVMKSLGPGLGTFATVGVSLGILLYYALPLMPFIYFFFAVGRWVKSIFEAMIGVPLWALAHLRLGGEGIPGPAAGQGYFLILEIFLRPILTLFGLMVSIGTFMALTVGLDSVFNLAVMNVGGFDMTNLNSGQPETFASSARDGMDALFYTAIYAILVYMIATSSFKLIDLIPNAVMRWAGTNVASFNDQNNPIDQINYQLVYKADALARSFDDQNKNFTDVINERNRSNQKS